MSHSAAAIDFAEHVIDDANVALAANALTFEQFVLLQRLWSESAFGRKYERGPAGPLKHLQKEVAEAVDKAQAVASLNAMISDAVTNKNSAVRDGGIAELKTARDEFLEELADCLFLVFDACWRAGFGPTDIRRMLGTKLAKNRARSWPRTAPDEPVEHDRSGEKS